MDAAGRALLAFPYWEGLASVSCLVSSVSIAAAPQGPMRLADLRRSLDAGDAGREVDLGVEPAGPAPASVELDVRSERGRARSLSLWSGNARLCDACDADANCMRKREERGEANCNADP